MGVDIIFRIAAIGIMIAILNALLEQSGRKEIAMMVTVTGLVLVLVMVANEISGLFETIKNTFGF